MRIRRTTLAIGGVACVAFGAVLAGRALAHDWLGECKVYFDHSFALEHLWAQARGTFAVPTGLSASGNPEQCDPATHAACWTYRRRCFSNYINVEPINYGHFHLSFQDPTVGACFADPGDGDGAGFGRESDSGCVPANWGEEPRYLQSHVQDHWIRVWMEDRVTHQPRVFDMSEMHVGSGVPIQLWFKRADGTWHCWRELDPATRWQVGEWAHDLIEVRIRGTNSGPGPYTIRGFTIQD